MNTGAEAVETAIKAARKWGYDVKGVPADRATIIVADGNFHGRTTTIVSFSTDPDARRGFGPYTPGFRVVPYGDAAALAAAIDETTVAVLLEPDPGRAGRRRPARRLPAGRPRAVHRARRPLHRRRDPVRARPHRHHARLRALGRPARPGHARQGARRRGAARLGRRRPGRRARRADRGHPRLDVRRQPAGVRRRPRGHRPAGDRRAAGPRHARSASSGAPASTPSSTTACSRPPRRVGLWAGLDVTPPTTGRQLCERLLARGVLAKDTHGSTIRLAPPLTITTDDLALATDRLTDALR